MRDTAVPGPALVERISRQPIPPGYFVSDLAETYPQQQVHVMGRHGCFVYHRQRMPQAPGQQFTNV